MYYGVSNGGICYFGKVQRGRLVSYQNVEPIDTLVENQTKHLPNADDIEPWKPAGASTTVESADITYWENGPQGDVVVELNQARVFGKTELEEICVMLDVKSSVRHDATTTKVIGLLPIERILSYGTVESI